MTDPDDGTPAGPAAEEAPVDPVAFWRLGPLPTPVPAEPEPWPQQVGRPEITVDGRNLADVLAPVYTTITGQEQE